MKNTQTLEKELQWFTEILKTRFDLYFNKETKYKSVYEIKPPDFSDDNSIYAKFINHYNLNFNERLAIVLVLVPHVRPQLLDVFYSKNSTYSRGFTEFGGINGESHGGFLPTGETLAFIVGGNNLTEKFNIIKIFDAEHVFAKHNILRINSTKENEPFLSGSLELYNDFIELFTLGKASKPNFSSKFPAKLIATGLEWDDFITENNVMQSINDILLWIKHKNKIMQEWDMQKTLKPGYRALFHGPPGTGKTFAASLIGKYTKTDVYKVDLSMVVSKWVGETEKNLARVFDMAENKDWILFFDEADALFGKRTKTQSSQERYANQEVAYLLQRTEDFPGTVILASNLKTNMDEAFARRFQSIIYFPIPKPKQRLKIWENYFSKTLSIDKSVDMKKIAQEYEITGGGIVNVLKYCAIQAAEHDSKIVKFDDLKEGIRKELLKEGKMI